MPEVRFGGYLCLSHNPGYSPGQGQATSYYNPIGPEAGVGYVWMMESDAQSLDFEEPQALTIDATETITIPRLYIDSAVAASGTFPGDSSRAYLLTLRDSRFLLDRLTDVNIAINCRPGAAPSDSTLAVDPKEFYQSTLNSLTALPYQWTDAIAWLWSLCPATLVGAFPGLPYLPEGVPQNLRYHGVSAWRALHDLLGRVRLTTVYDAAADAFGIIDLAEPQPNLSAVANYTNRLLNDRYPGGSIKARVPTAIRVYFAKQAQHCGTEMDTPRANNWQDLGALYWNDIPTGASSELGTVVGLHDDSPAMCDINGIVLNAGELAARAADRASQWTAAKILEVARGSLIIQGIAAPLATPGSQVSGVLLRNYGDGWMTELALTPNQSVGNGLRAVGGVTADENFAPPDLARRTWPSYPRVSQLVKVTNSSKDGNGLCQGFVVQANPTANFSTSSTSIQAYKTLEACLIAAANGEALSNRTYLARLNGVAWSSAAGWVPLYITQPSSAPMLVQMQADCPFGQSAKANQVSVPKGQKQGQEAAAQPPVSVTVFNKLHGLLRKNSYVWVDDDGDGWYSVTALANAFVARVNAGQADAAIGYNPVDAAIKCTVYDYAAGSLNASQAVVKAYPTYAPVLDNELVLVEYVWPASDSTNNIWIITRGELDGGWMGTTFSTAFSAAKGATGMVYTQPSLLGPNTQIQQTPVQCQFTLGGITGNKNVWVNRNRGGFFVTAAECSPTDSTSGGT